MKKSFVRAILIILIACIGFFAFQNSLLADWFGNHSGGEYLNNNGTYTLESGAEAARDSLQNVEKDRSLAQLIVDVVKYLLTFIALIGVLVIIYAGFSILVSGGDEEKLKSGRRMIFYALIGIVLIFFAGPIVFWIEDVFNRA